MIIIILIIIHHHYLDYHHHHHYHYLNVVLLNLGMERVLERGGRPGPRLIPLIPIITRPRLKMKSILILIMAQLIPDRLNRGESILNQANMC